MSERTTVHLLRHGEVHNPAKVLYGRIPGFLLSTSGHDMARAAADALRDRDVTVLVSSPLERAQQTAVPLAETLGLTPRIDDRLIESANVFEGRTVEFGAGSLKSPSLWRHLYNPFTPSWGEPYSHIAARMALAVEQARDEARGHEAVCVSHQLPIWVARRHLEGRRLWHRPDRRQCGLASLTSVTYDGDRLVALTYSEPAGEASRTKAPPGA
ncbi:MAG TPA: histidine phosphatase family protein [Mycobacteriales bacterium]|nr:histidine phosphatase family protein [Mycobacteriales bacterium]